MVIIHVETETCSHCHEEYEEEALQYDAGRMLCETCIKAVFVHCDACSTLVHEDEAKTILRDSAHYCRDCVRAYSIQDPDRYTEFP